jgi:signal transduction histidine kinase/HAMP domain-containing protein
MTQGLSLRAREIVAVTSLTLLVVALSTTLHLYHARQIVWSSTLREADLVARQIYSQSAQALSRRAGQEPRIVLAQDRDLRALIEASVGYAPGLLYALIADQDNVTIIHSDRKREGERVAPQPGFRERASMRSPPIMAGGPQIYEVTLPFAVAGKPFATIRLGIAVPLMKSQLDDVFWYTVALGVVALAAALVVALALSGLALKPIRKLAEDMERLGRGEFDVGSAAGPKDEFGKLAYQLQLLGKQIQSDRTQILTERTQIQSAVDQLEDGLVFCAADHRVLFANRAAEAALGLPLKDVVGSRLGDILEADHPVRTILQRALEDGAASRNVRIDVPSNGGPMGLLVSAFPIGDGPGGTCDGAILVARDLKSVAVSARTLQSLIQYSAQLAALGQVTSEVTHDVKNPLHAMAMHVAFLRERLPEAPPDVRRSLDILEAEINRADSVLNRFLEAVRPSEPSRQPVDVNRVLSELTALLQSRWQARGVTLVAQLEPGLPPATGDEDLLRRAFMNVIVNACQAMSEGGPVTIATEAEGEGRVKISVTDTGVGIQPAELEQIFAMYYTTKADGTGIGLPLVRRVVDLHQGTVEILSTVGQGTSVIIRLPVESAP